MATVALESKPTNTTFVVVIYAAIFVASLAAGARWLDPLLRLGEDAFFAIARAQYEMHLAAQNVDASGRAEYAVLLCREAAYQALDQWVDGRDNMSARASAIPGWSVVSMPQDEARDVVEALREQPFARAVLRNRGLWICH